MVLSDEGASFKNNCFPEQRWEGVFGDGVVEAAFSPECSVSSWSFLSSTGCATLPLGVPVAIKARRAEQIHIAYIHRSVLNLFSSAYGKLIIKGVKSHLDWMEFRGRKSYLAPAEGGGTAICSLFLALWHCGDVVLEAHGSFMQWYAFSFWSLYVLQTPLSVYLLPKWFWLRCKFRLPYFYFVLYWIQ